MQRFVYTIEVQKPTVTTRFLKVFDSPLIINKKEVSQSNPQEISLFDDRTEVYSFLKILDANSEESLLDSYYNLVKTYHLSLEFTKDDWVYLIPRRHPKRTFRLAHKLPVLPRYKIEKPFKFYKVKPIDDLNPEEIDDEESLAREFFTKKYFYYFTNFVQKLLYCYQGRHSFNYVIMEAFVLTYGYYFRETKPNNFNEKVFSLIQILEKPYQQDDAADLRFIRYDQSLVPETYQTYIKPTLEGEVPFLPNGQFYSLNSKQMILRIFWNFLEAAQKWVEENGNC